MRILGVDYGLKRTGLAIWDSQVNIVLPMMVIDDSEYKSAAQSVADTAFFEKAEIIVVGDPLTLSGQTSGEQAEATERFMRALDRRTRIPIVVEDERLSSQMAERLQLEAGGARQAAATDALAAAVILEAYVNRERPGQRTLDDLVGPVKAAEVREIMRGGVREAASPATEAEEGTEPTAEPRPSGSAPAPVPETSAAAAAPDVQPTGADQPSASQVEPASGGQTRPEDLPPAERPLPGNL